MTAPHYRVPDTDPLNTGNRPGDGPLRAGGKSVSSLPVTDEANLPSTPSPSARKQAPGVTLCRDLDAGPERVRDAGQTYLPKNPGEDQKNYAVRLARSVFYNAFGHTAEGLTGFVFRKDPVLGDDVPPVMQEHWENIDLAGTHGDVFARDLLQDALVAGHTAILVDYPNVGDVRLSLAAEAPLRPYWVPIRKENILSWRTTVEHGVTILTQVVLKECTYVASGAFGEKEQTRYRVLYRANGVVGFTLLEVNDNRQVVAIEDGYYRNQTEIPLAEIVTSGRRGLFESAPPLLDLAYLNVAHYQQWSDYATSMHMTCVPILFAAGVEMKDESGNAITVGPNAAVSSTDPNAKLGYVSHDGAALEQCRTALNDMKGDMATLGLAMLSPDKRVAETATAKRIDKSTSDSALSVTARGLQDGLERALQFHANYLRLEDGGSIAINRDFENLTLDAQSIAALSSLVEKGQLTIETLWAMLISGNVLPDGFDADAERATLDAEAEIRRVESVERMRAVATMQGNGPPDALPPVA